MLAVTTGALVVLGAWMATSAGQPEIVFPGPVRTMSALGDLVRTGELWTALGGTLLRCALGMAVALAVGLPWGLLAGWQPVIADLSEVALRLLMAVPPVVFVVLAMIWLGPGPSAVVLVVALVGLPLMMVTAREALRGLDGDLVEMARVFRLSRWRIVRHVVAPGVAGPVLAAVSVLLGQSLRVTVMAELLAAATGVGHAVALSRATLETADLFAWALALVVLALLIEELVVRPVRNRAVAH